MKKLTKIVLFLTVLALSVIGFTACKAKPETVDSIAIGDMPQLTYVKGSDLDLSDGELEIKIGKKTEKLSLDSSKITVTGYNSNKLGAQELTISYKGKETTLTVTVVERVQVENYIADYLVGAEQDLSRGQIRVTRDDGTSYTVFLNDPSVTVTGFNSSQPTDSQLIRVHYEQGNTNEDGEFTVNIHEVEEVRFQRPSKVNYYSHEEALDLRGSYLTLSGNNGNTTRLLQVTSEMTDGFNPGVATKENDIDNPLSQTITVTYEDDEFSFDILVEYTKISEFKDAARALSEIDWTEEGGPVISQDNGELALSAMQLYFALPEVDQAFITEDEILTVARPAMFYGYGVWSADLEDFEGAFSVNQAGSISIEAISPDVVEDAIEALADTDRDIYAYGPTLYAISVLMGDEVLVGTTRFSDYPVFLNEEFYGLSDMLQYMLDLHEKFEAISDEWTEETVSNYATEIEAAYEFIADSEYANSASSALYAPINSWREGNDCFNILYAYYFEKYVQGIDEKDEALESEAIRAMFTLSELALPTELNDLFSSLMEAMSYINVINYGILWDTTPFIHQFFDAKSRIDNINNGDSDMLKFLAGNVILNSLLGTDPAETGYTYFEDLYNSIHSYYIEFVGQLYGTSQYEELMNEYMQFTEQLMADEEGTFAESPEYGEAVESMFAKFTKLTPTNKYLFLIALYPYFSYHQQQGMTVSQFDTFNADEGYYSVFAHAINSYFTEQFESSAMKANVTEFLVLIEASSAIYIADNGIEAFKTAFAAFEAKYDTQFTNNSEFTKFEQYFGEMYTELKAANDSWLEDFELGEAEDVINELINAIFDIDFIYNFYFAEGLAFVDMLVAFYEKADGIATEIMEGLSDDAKYAYLYAPAYSFLEIYYGRWPMPSDPEGGESVEPVYTYVSLEYYLTVYRGQYLTYLCYFMQSEDFEGINLYDSYVAGDLPEFMGTIADIFNMWMYSTETKPADYDVNEIVSIMNSFTNMSLEDKMTFMSIESLYPIYYMVLEDFSEIYFVDEEGVAYSKAKGTFDQLVLVEQYYCIYMNSVESESETADVDRATLDEQFNSLEVWYNDLNTAEEELEAFEPFMDMYNEIVGLYEAIDAEETPAQA